MLRGTVCGGPTMKLHHITRLIINIQTHSCLQHSLDIFWVIVNLRLGFFPSTVWCMLCFLFVRVHGHDGDLSSSSLPPPPNKLAPLDAIGSCICGASTATGAFTTWLEWSA